MFINQAEPVPATTSWAKTARLAVALTVGWSVSGGYGQTVISGLGSGGTLKLRQTDLATLEQGEPRSDLPCTVSRMKPELDWDFTFHTGYQVEVPRTDWVGKGGEMTILFRVIPQDRPDDPVYMFEKLGVPAVDEGQKGMIEYQGTFAVGEGRYHVDWLMRDQRERICAASWELETKLNSKDSQLRQWVPQTLAGPIVPPFAEEPPVLKAAGSGSPHVSIIVNFDPPDPSAVHLDGRDLESLVRILRRIGDDPRIETYSIIACSLETQQVVYQEEDTSRMHLPALAKHSSR